MNEVPLFYPDILAPQLGVEEYYGAKLDVASITSRSGLPWGCSLQDGDHGAILRSQTLPMMSLATTLIRTVIFKFTPSSFGESRERIKRYC
jgi:hypothetical protein